MTAEVGGWQWLVGDWSIEATQFLVQRSHYDHPEMPDAVAVTGIVDGTPAMHYFDVRGVHRVFAVEIDGRAERSGDAPTWALELAITYCRIG